MSRAIDVVIAYQDAWVGRDFDRARTFIADDVVFVSSAGQHITGHADFMAMLSAFAMRIQPRWEQAAVLEDAGGVLILYRLFTQSGEPAFCADYFVVRSGKIQSDTLVFDREPFTRPAAR